MTVQDPSLMATEAVRAPGVIGVGMDADQWKDEGPHPSLDAVRYAAELARRLGARLIPVWVRVPITLSDLFVEPKRRLIAERGERISEVRTVLQGAVDGITLGSLVVREGNPFDELTAVAQDVGTDNIVVGASEHRLGSLAMRLIRDARWPVTVVP